MHPVQDSAAVAADTLSGLRATRAVVDLDAIETNVRVLRRAITPQTELLAVVKADAYGHGASEVARAVLAAGASRLGVATINEARALRGGGVSAPILVLGAIAAGESDAACQLGLELTIGDAALLGAVQRAVRFIQPNEPLRVHVKIDTGLRRYGVDPAEALEIAQRVAADPYLRLEAICTHFASADEPAEPFTGGQLASFMRVAMAIDEAGIRTRRHVANSAGILTGRGVDLDLVRPGIALYGIAPSAFVPLLPGMRPALRIESRITRIVPISPGDTVGYNRTFRAERPMRGALVPIGYADGYRRSLSNRGWVGIGGCAAQVLGRVSMDQMVVEIPSGITAEVGDVVHVLGGDAAPSLEDMATLMETNPYEVLVGIRRRVPRVYVSEGHVVAVNDGAMSTDDD
jgi:alanine racemase